MPLNHLRRVLRGAEKQTLHYADNIALKKIHNINRTLSIQPSGAGRQHVGHMVKGGDRISQSMKLEHYV